MAMRKIPTRGTKTPEGTRQISTKWDSDTFDKVYEAAKINNLSFAEQVRAFAISGLRAMGVELGHVGGRRQSPAD